MRATRLYLVLALFLVGWGVYESYTSERWLEGLPLIVFGTFLLVATRPFTFWQLRRAARRSPSYGSEITYTFEPERITISGEGHQSIFTWKKLYSATIADDGILLYTQKTLFHWIPVSAFASPSDMETVRSFLERSGVRIGNA